MTKKKKSVKEYSSTDVRGVKWLRTTTGKSIRAIAKETGIPKSVIGRWIKEDEIVYVRKYDFRDVKRKVRENLTKKDYEKFLKIENKILHNPIGKQSELTIEYYDDDDGEGGYYSVNSP